MAARRRKGGQPGGGAGTSAEADVPPGSPRVTVVGLGPAGPEYLAPAARTLLTGTDRALLRTARHPAAAGLGYLETFDRYYDTAATFEQVYERIVETLVQAAAEAAERGGQIVYGVPGSPLVAERTVDLLRADPRVTVTVVPALSFLDLAWARLGVDPVAAGVRLVDGTRFAEQAAGTAGPMLVAQCWSTQVLSDIKLSVDADVGPGPPPVTLLHHLGLEDERVEVLGWEEMDHVGAPDHMTSVYIPALATPVAAELVALDELVRTLRARCPWDREQTHRSLTRHLLEEAYEVVDAIDALSAAEAATPGPGDGGAPGAAPATEVEAAAAPATEAEAAAVAHLQEELGDLLFQVYFHACLAAEEGRFTLADVARGIHEKLVARHPHVFGDAEAADAEAVLAGWERAKMAEKGRQSVTDGIPAALPALALAAKLQRKALAVPGLQLPTFEAERRWVAAALAQLSTPGAAGPDDPSARGDLGSVPAIAGDEEVRRVGALLWGLADLGRQLGVDPEDSLRAAALRFRAHVQQAERVEPAERIQKDQRVQKDERAGPEPA